MDNILKLSEPTTVHPNTMPSTANQSLFGTSDFMENIVNKAANSDTSNKKAYFKFESESDMSPKSHPTLSQINTFMNMFKGAQPSDAAVNDMQQALGILPPPPTASTSTNFLNSQQKPQLTNFLVVKFEIMTNNESTSKSKSRYKKSIKIHSIQTKVFNQSDNKDSNAYTTQKAYEFTEKCFSFRLACLDLQLDPVDQHRFIKLVNMNDKSLVALINFGNLLKFFQVKHEESSTTNQKQQIDIANTGTTSILSATSSSRLNLTEFLIDNLVDPKDDLYVPGVLNLIPICVSTFDDDLDVRAMAMLDQNGAVHVIDPFKLTRLALFALPSNGSEEKFIKIAYCNGIY
jgi:hypothetical protein